MYRNLRFGSYFAQHLEVLYYLFIHDSIIHLHTTMYNTIKGASKHCAKYLVNLLWYYTYLYD